MRSTTFYELVSGRRRGVGASLLRALLAMAEGPYRAGVWWRNRRYDNHPELVHSADIPVVSVGNLTLGGTGKTPLVKWIARYLRNENVRVAILSRGYGSSDGGPNDEALELEQSLPDVPHLQNPDRVASARVAAEELASQILVLDDGFQHRRIARDLDLVLLDATEPFGYGHVFPRGALREPIASVRRADVVCLTRSNLVNEQRREHIRQHVNKIAPGALWCEAITHPTSLVAVAEEGSSLTETPLTNLADKRVLLFCGIGNPAAFRATVEEAGATVTQLIEYPDHHAYDREDIERITRSAERAQVDHVICTQKDLVKIGVGDLEGIPLDAIAIEAQFTVGEEQFTTHLRQLAERAKQPDQLEEDLRPFAGL